MLVFLYRTYLYPHAIIIIVIVDISIIIIIIRRRRRRRRRRRIRIIIFPTRRGRQLQHADLKCKKTFQPPYFLNTKGCQLEASYP